MSRPSKFDADAAARILATIQAAGTVEDAAALAGVDDATVYRWLAEGRAARRRKDPKREFCEAYRRAQARRRIGWEAQLLQAGKQDWRALLAYMQIADPRRYAPRVRVHVEQELSDGIERLKAAFCGQPETLERILAALAGEDGGSGTPDTAPPEDAPPAAGGAGGPGGHAVPGAAPCH